MAPCVYRSRYWHWVPRGQRSGGWTPNWSTLRTSYWLSTVLDINVDIIYYGRYQGRYQGLHSRMAGGQGRSAPEDEEAWHSSHTLGTHLTPWHTMNTALGFIIYYLLCLLSKHINIYYLLSTKSSSYLLLTKHNQQACLTQLNFLLPLHQQALGAVYSGILRNSDDYSLLSGHKVAHTYVFKHNFSYKIC